MLNLVKRTFHSAVTAYVVIVLSFAVSLGVEHAAEQRDIARNCTATQNEWDTFQHLIVAAVHPPSRAGQKLTDEQQRALRAYRAQLNSSIGDRPVC